jgi:hypothetical protein
VLRLGGVFRWQPASASGPARIGRAREPAETRRIPKLRRALAALFAPIDAASIAVFRIAFGALMVVEVLDDFRHDWFTADFVSPSFRFKYYGFEWIDAWPVDALHAHFAILGVLGGLISLGLHYRAASVLFFLGFTYVFLLDQAAYLNHFYLIVLLSLMLAVVPAQRMLSMDARHARLPATVPAWTLLVLRAQVGIPYFYAGLAKLNGDWLRGEPLRTWLDRRRDLPLLGPLLTYEPVPWLLVYGALFLDLAVVPLLLWRRTRLIAFAAAAVFHTLNAALFTIGIFPWLMIAATTLFFAPEWPRRFLGLAPPTARESGPAPSHRHAWLAAALGAYLSLQLLVPLRHWLYPGDVNWTEEGHRFSWRMKLRDKEAHAVFQVTVFDADGVQRIALVDPREYLTRDQAAKMAARPDMVLQFAHFLAAEKRRQGHARVKVRAQALVSLNGRRRQFLVDPTVDLAAEKRSLAPASWILPSTLPLPR